MATENQPPPPEMIPEPPPVGERSDYVPAAQEITSENVDLVENFIGSIYGEAKRIDHANIGDNRFTKGVKIDAHKEILNLRQSVNPQGQNHTPPVKTSPVVNQPPMAHSPQPVMNQQPSFVQPGDSLILKHEIDQLKEQLVDIKKLYNEFFKLKMVKGKWNITCDGKTQSTVTISKTWNVLNKMLKNKSKSINIEYVDDE
jgi:hypothetical protein